MAETVNLCMDFCEIAPDSLTGDQFVQSVSVILCSVLNSSKVLLRAAKFVCNALDKWASNFRPNASGSSIKKFYVTSDDFRNKMEVFVKSPPPLFDEDELKRRVASEIQRLKEVELKRKSLMSSKSKGFYGNKFEFDISELNESKEEIKPAVEQPQLDSPVLPRNDDGEKPKDEDFELNAFDMPGNPLMGKADADGVIHPLETEEDSSENSPKSPVINGLEVVSASIENVHVSNSNPGMNVIFREEEYNLVARARTEEQLMSTPIAIWFKRMVSSETPEPFIVELFYLISNPSNAKCVKHIPAYKKQVQRVRTILKLIHVASVIAKDRIKVIGRTIFQDSAVTQQIMSVLWQCLLPVDVPLEGDKQLRFMHETLRIGHFCDIMELLRMFYRERVLEFLSESNLFISGLKFRPAAMLVDRLEYDGVMQLLISLLGSELVLPRNIWFSNKCDLIQLMMSKLVFSGSERDSLEVDRGAENASTVLKKIVSSLDHTFLNTRITQLQKQLHSRIFDPLLEGNGSQFSEKQFRYAVRVLSDWALMIYGKFRIVDEQTFSECITTTISYFGLIKHLLTNKTYEFVNSSDKTRISGFVKLELINLIAALVNAKNVRIDDAIIAHELLEIICQLFFDTSKASVLDSHITEFILVPICEDSNSKLLNHLMKKIDFLQKLMNIFVNSADDTEERKPTLINGFLTVIATAISKSGAADDYPGYDKFVRTKLLPMIKLQVRDDLTQGISPTVGVATPIVRRSLVID